MNTYISKAFMAVASLVVLVGLAGCQCVGAADAEPAPPERRVVERTETVVRWESPLVIEKMAPEQVSVGKEFEARIRVRNAADRYMSDVVITDELGTGLSFVRATPQPNSRNPLTWELGRLEAEETKTITVVLTADKTGTVEQCALGTYRLPVCEMIDVVAPQLAIEKTGPAEVIKCDTITYEYTVRNPGSGTAKNVKITDDLPDGLQTMDGQGSFTQNVGDLSGGQSKSYTLDVKPQRTGTFTNEAVATADGDLRDSDSVQTQVKQPVLTLEKTGLAKIFLGQNVTYTITVGNTGDAPARQLKVVDTIGTDTTFVRASDGGTASGGTVTWDLGTLQPGAEKELTVTVTGTRIDDEITNRVRATAVCADEVTAQAVTQVAGISAVLLEVADERDPVAVGLNETYTIVVTNQGSLKDTNIRITATLDPAMEFVSADGATDGEVDGRTVTFEPLAELAPKDKATWKLVVKATEAATQVRLTLEMETDNIDGPPVMETEATNFYE